VDADKTNHSAANAAGKPRRDAVSLTVLNGGVVRTREAIVVPKGSRRLVDIPALFGLIQHPSAGIGLFDTGYSTRYYAATRQFPYRLYRYVTPVKMRTEHDAVEQLARRGIAADDVRWIVLSHFDPDHIGGLCDFPRARVICLRSAWSAVAGKRGWAALKSRLLPDLLPKDLEDRLQLIDAVTGPGEEPFASCHDLFGDGTMRLVDLPGHAAGHLGALVRCDDGRDVLLVADACWSRAGLRHGGGVVHRALAHDREQQDATYRLLGRLMRERPDLVLIPSHCPEAASEWLPGGAWRFSP